MPRICSLFCVIVAVQLLIFNVLVAQQPPIEFTITIKNYHYDTLWWGQSFGKRALPMIPTPRQTNGSFVFRFESAVPAGFYAIVYKRAPKAKFQFFPVVLTEGQGSFSLETRLDDFYDNPLVSGNRETQLLFAYLKTAEALAKTRDSLAFQWRDVGTPQLFEQWMLAEENVRQFQEKFIEKHPNTWATWLAQQTMVPRPLAHSPAATEPEQHWQFMFDHYFSNKNSSDLQLFCSPAFVEYLDYFVFKLPLPQPQYIQHACDRVFAWLQNQPEGLRYYFNYVVNSFGSISKYQGDEVFYYLVKNYVEQGKAPWSSAEEIQKLSDEAQRMEKLFVGKTPSPITLYQRDGSPFPLHSVAARRTLLIFWNPDCGHCKKEIPILKKITREFEASDLKVVAICGKKQDESKQCWEFVAEQAFPSSWTVLHDPDGKSRMQVVYNLRSYPRLFLLDEQKKILWKRFGEVPEAELLRVFNRWVRE